MLGSPRNGDYEFKEGWYTQILLKATIDDLGEFTGCGQEVRVQYFILRLYPPIAASPFRLEPEFLGYTHTDGRLLLGFRKIFDDDSLATYVEVFSDDGTIHDATCQDENTMSALSNANAFQVTRMGLNCVQMASATDYCTPIAASQIYTNGGAADYVIAADTLSTTGAPA